MAGIRFDDQGRRIIPRGPGSGRRVPIPGDDINRNNENRPSIDTWMAPRAQMMPGSDLDMIADSGEAFNHTYMDQVKNAVRRSLCTAHGGRAKRLVNL